MYLFLLQYMRQGKVGGFIVPAYSPLSQDKETAKEFKLSEVHELPKDQKLAFLQSQRQELLNGVWRERVNVLHARRLIEDENETMRNRGLNNITEHKHTLRQFAGGIDTLDALIKELENE